MSKIEQIKIDLIRIDGGTQPRVKIDQPTVDEYAAAIKDGAMMPEVTVYHDGKTYWLADGFHRVLAAQRCEQKTIACAVVKGTQRDAILFSVGANAQHGLRRDPEDKRAAVRTLLSDAEWCTWSDREIAKACAVSQPFVGQIRKVLTDNVISENKNNRNISSDRKYITKHGTPATMNTARIGKPAATAKEDWTEASSEPESESESEPAATALKEAVTARDQVGEPIPAKLAPLFADDFLNQLQGSIQNLRASLSHEAKAGRALLAHASHQSIDIQLKNAWEQIKFAKPYAVCPKCKGGGAKCQPCKGSGWLTRGTYEQLPSELRRGGGL